MQKYVFNQEMNAIWNAADCMPIHRVGNQIFGIAYSIEDYIQNSEDVQNKGMKKHLIELGVYDSEERADLVMIYLVRWLRGLDGDNVFIMPAYNENIICRDGKLIYRTQNLIEEMGEPDNEREDY
ncbi:MAG: hypothetical protein ACI4EI_08100 [Muricoprocola sp.]